jgi:hypothetical protein
MGTERRTRKRVLVIPQGKVPLKLYSAASLDDCASDWSDSSPNPDSPSHSRKRRQLQKAQDTLPAVASRQLERHERDDDDGEVEVAGAYDHSDPLRTAGSSTVKFCSRSETICAEMLLRYVPHFELREGVTFQVAIGRDSQGNTLAVDFLVDGVLFEYHPVRLFKNRRRCGDFNSKREYRAYANISHSLKGDQRDFFQLAMRSRLAQNYYAKRRALLDQHPMYRRMELVVASTPEEFYFLVLKRFGRNAPRSVERFLAIFDELRESLATE